MAARYLGERTADRDRFWRDLLVLVVLIGGFHALCNFAFLIEDDSPPHFDTSNHFRISIKHYRHLATTDSQNLETLPARLSGVDRYYPPLFYLSTAPLYAVRGISFPTARGINTFYLILLLLGTYGIGARLFNRPTGLLAAAVISLYPIVFGLSRDYYPDLALLAWMAVTVYFLLATEGLRRTGVAVLFGLAYGLGQLTKQPFTFFAAGPCLFVFFDSVRPYRSFGKALAVPIRIGASRWSVPALGVLALLAGWDALRLLFDPDRGILLTLRLGAEALVALAALGGAVVVFRRGWKELPDLPAIRRNHVRIWGQIGNTALAAAIAFAVAAPFYLTNWQAIRELGTFVVTQAGADRGMAPASEAVFDYLGFLVENQTHGFFAALVVLGLLLFPTRNLKGKLFLVFSFLFAYAVMSTFRTKDPRYTMPFLYALAPLSVVWIPELRRASQRWIAAVLVLGVGLLQFLAISFDWGMAEGRPTTPWTQWVQRSPYGSTQNNLDNWRNRDMVTALETFAGDEPVRVGFLCHSDFFEYASFECEALRRTPPLPYTFEKPENRLAGDYPRLAFTFLQNDFVVTKTGHQGPAFTLRAAAVLREEFADPRSCLRERYLLLREYELPDASTARLWMRRDRWPDPAPPEAALPLVDLEVLGHRARGMAVAPAGTVGGHLPVHMAWGAAPEPTAGLLVIVQLRDESGTPVLSEVLDPAAGEAHTVDGEAFHLRRYRVYLNPEAIGAGVYEAAILFVDGEGGIRQPRTTRGPAARVMGPTAAAAGATAGVMGATETIRRAMPYVGFRPDTPGILRAELYASGSVPATLHAGVLPSVDADGIVHLGPVRIWRESRTPGMTCAQWYQNLAALGPG